MTHKFIEFLDDETRSENPTIINLDRVCSIMCVKQTNTTVFYMTDRQAIVINGDRREEVKEFLSRVT